MACVRFPAVPERFRRRDRNTSKRENVKIGMALPVPFVIDIRVVQPDAPLAITGLAAAMTTHLPWGWIALLAVVVLVALFWMWR